MKNVMMFIAGVVSTIVVLLLIPVPAEAGMVSSEAHETIERSLLD